MTDRLSGERDRGPLAAAVRRLALIAVLGLVAAACGGDTTVAESSDVSEAGGEGGSAADGAGEPATGAKFASVTLGGETYITDLSRDGTVCLSIGGALGGQGPVEGVEKSKLSIDLAPEDWETNADGWSPPSIGLDLGEDVDGVPIDWRAGGEIVLTMADLDGKSQVDSYRIDGLTASGTATFIDFFQVQLGNLDGMQPVVATFEISCG